MSQAVEDYTNKELMAAFVASEIHDDETVSVGASLPVCRAGILLAHLTHAPSLKVQMAFTMTNLRNVEVLDAFEFITDWRAARWAEYLYNHDLGPDLYKRRRKAIFFIGGLQIDAYGNSNLIGIGSDYHHLKMRGPGGVGTASMGTNIGRYYLYVNSHKSFNSKRLPSSFRVLSQMITVFGSAIPCMRAARFGVLPTMPRSCASPDPRRSPTTTRPVAIPTRVCSEARDLSAVASVISSSPARTARSASSS